MWELLWNFIKKSIEKPSKFRLMLIVLLVFLLFGLDQTFYRLGSIERALKPSIPSLAEMHALTHDIESECDGLLASTGVSSCSVFEFHNGQHPVTGYSWLRMSNTYESLTSPMISEKYSFQNIPMRDLSEWVPLLIQRKCFNDQDIPNTTFSQWYKSKQKVARYLVCPLVMDGYNEPIGIIVTTFVADTRGPFDRQYQLMQLSAARISKHLKASRDQQQAGNNGG